MPKDNKDMERIFQALGGLTTLVKFYVYGLIEEEVETVEKAADRIFTVSERDTRKICKALGIKDEEKVKEAVEKARIAGDKMGDYLAFLTVNSAKYLVENPDTIS